MRVVHLMASPFVGGPERQVLGMAENLPAGCRTAFLSFAEGGKARPFLDEARRRGFEAVELAANSPHLFRAAGEVAGHLRRLRADVLCTSGYKPDVIGWLAARRAGVPVAAIAHGWTAATWKVRLNEALDRLVLRAVDTVVCVSEAQAVKVRRAGVDPRRVAVIRNAVAADAFDTPDPAYRRRLHDFFATPPARVVAAGGRLSPEKGFDLFVSAAAEVARRDPGIGFILFGDGPLREALAAQVAALGLGERFVLAGFRTDLQAFLPVCDLAVLSSHTEGLPVVVLEALAAGVPVVATAVGGTPEVIVDGEHGYLVSPGDPAALARRILDALACDEERRAMGARGRQRVRDEFTFAAQAARYHHLFERLTNREDERGVVRRPPAVPQRSAP
jgi:glycosyltransferase involved in cell wall biosynthesis